jgi:hypothetical protein
MINNESGGFEWVGEDSAILQEYGENVITQMVMGDGTVVTAVASDFEGEESEITHRLVRVPGKKEAVVLVNIDFIQDMVSSHDHPFGAGFAFGVFIGQVCSEVGDDISGKGPNDDWKL